MCEKMTALAARIVVMAMLIAPLACSELDEAWVPGTHEGRVRENELGYMGAGGSGEREGKGEGSCTYFDDFIIATNHMMFMLEFLAPGIPEFAALLAEFGADFSTYDWEGAETFLPPPPDPPFGDGILDLWQLALVAEVLCNPDNPHHEAVSAAFSDNYALVYETGQFSEIGARTVATLIGVSTAYKNTMVYLGGLAGYYKYPVFTSDTVFTSGSNEIFSADGDLDGDGDTNLEEYLAVTDRGGDMTAFVSAATTVGPFWPGNPDLPIAWWPLALNASGKRLHPPAASMPENGQIDLSASDSTSGNDCPGDPAHTHTYDADTTVTITATPDPTYPFLNWAPPLAAGSRLTLQHSSIDTVAPSLLSGTKELPWR